MRDGDQTRGSDYTTAVSIESALPRLEGDGLMSTLQSSASTITAPTDGLTISPLAGALGAEISGIDLARPIAQEQFDAVHRALLDYLVVFFPDQHLTPTQQRDFAAKFGDLDFEPFVYPLKMPALEGHPEVYQIVKEPQDRTINLGGFWHADVTYRERPNLGSVVYMTEAPSSGGDTLFSNQYLAYETLSGGMQGMLEGLRAVHTSSMPYGGTSARFAAVNRTHVSKPEDRVFNDPATGGGEVFEWEHPVVRRHPDTGRRSLYINRAFTSHFCNMTVEESQPLLEYLWKHAERPEFTCRYHWTPNSLGIWDNRCVLHYALNDYYGERRVMHRISIHEAGSPSLAATGSP